MTNRPILAATMGDPAGIGPEIASARCWRLKCETFHAHSSSVTYECWAGRWRCAGCRLNCIGSVGPRTGGRGGRDRRAAPGQRRSRVLRMGEVQPLGGEAAFAAIRASIDLAMAGRVAGVVTAPINKELLQAAKIPFIGHTEMFAEYTGATEEMTMFTIVGLKIFFLTRHMSLAQACASITVPKVAKGIEQCIKALHQLGYEAPHLAVAALNPHGGEDGMFGREEIEGIKPAIAAARAKGFRISGPVPATRCFIWLGSGGTTRSCRCTTTRGYRGENDGFREDGVGDAGVARAADQRRSRHGVRYRRDRQGQRGQHDRSDPCGGGIRGARGEARGCAGGGSCGGVRVPPR